MNDQNNPAHLRAAWERIAQKHSIMITPKVAAELRGFGIELPPLKPLVTDNEEKTVDFVIAGFYDLRFGVYFPDNVIGRCGCGRFLQWRPHAPALPKICLFCAAERD